MTKFEWDESLNTGDAMIDREHQTLARLLTEASQLSHCSDSDEKMMTCLTDMYLYAKEHFFDEEGLMERLGYPEREAHMAMHKAFVEKTHTLTDACLEGSMNFKDLVAFLIEWSREHIAVEDEKIMRFARNHGELKA